VNWIVPDSGLYTITAKGAQGGARPGYTSGLGASMQGVFSLAFGQTLSILVGEKPIDAQYPGGTDCCSCVQLTRNTL
jgi:hypothetical protein